MEKWIKNILTIFVIGFFGFLALACDDENIEWDCDEADPALLESETLDPGVQGRTDFTLVFLDKETNLPVKGIYVKCRILESHCEKHCAGRCAMNVAFGDNDSYSTDVNGKIEGNFGNVLYEDKKDRALISFDAEDLSGVYTPKRISFRYDYVINSLTLTTYLIKNNAL